MLQDDIPEKVDLSSSLPLPKSIEVYDNQGASETWGQGGEKSPEMKNKTIEELRKDSTSSMRKPSSPFRRISSPLTRSGRFSLTGIFGRRSVDMEAEAVNLMVASPVTSPTDEHSFALASSSEGEKGGAVIAGRITALIKLHYIIHQHLSCKVVAVEVK